MDERDDDDGSPEDMEPEEPEEEDAEDMADLEDRDEGDAGVSDGEELMKERARGGGERRTTSYLTKYERARVLGTRALQIRYGRDIHIQMCFLGFGTSKKALRVSALRNRGASCSSNPFPPRLHHPKWI